MKSDYQLIEASTPFEKSQLWQLNRDYYQEAGISAWSNGDVPHNMTSNTNVGKSYAAIILGFLKDLAIKGLVQENVYIIELGSGHGRLAFHILKHLDIMIASEPLDLPNYCYVLTDIIESNLTFFEEHPQLDEYFESNKLDVAFFDGESSEELYLRKKQRTLSFHSLEVPLMAIANYFFDSIPAQLYYIQNRTCAPCSISLESFHEEGEVSCDVMLANLKSTVSVDSIKPSDKENGFITDLLKEYKSSLKETYLLLPHLALRSVDSLKKFSKNGLVLISMDKGYFELQDLDNRPQPEIIRHGSFSLYVNFHAIKKYCDTLDGKTLYTSFSNNTMQLGCFLFIKSPETFTSTIKSFNQSVNDYSPDDYNGLKKMTYRLVSQLTLAELITTIRLGYYDSTQFIKLLPFIRKQLKTLNIVDRVNLCKALIQINNYFFNINEVINVSNEIAGFFYDMAFYQESLDSYDKQVQFFGYTGDIYYNKILCYYQLRMDQQFVDTLNEAKVAFPDFENFAHLDTLDLGAV